MSTAEVVVACRDLDVNLGFFQQEGFRVDRVSPADDPAEVSMSLGELRLLLRRADDDRPVHVVVEDEPANQLESTVTAPNGSTIERRCPTCDVVVPDAAPSLSIVRAADGDADIGRAGMHYRDLLPGRWGGRFIASHITIPGGGEVADWVHYHRIRFQVIFCAAGWVDVVYEDQGEPFRMRAGDCVLQPPEIRHRVLRSSPGVEVIEVGCPAVHDTLADHDVDLPNGRGDPQRRFDGQRFVRHVAVEHPTQPWIAIPLLARDTGIAHASGGLADVSVLSVTDDDPSGSGISLVHDGEFLMHVVLSGAVRWSSSDSECGPLDLQPGDAIAIPPGLEWSWRDWSPDVEVLSIALPAGAVRSVEERRA